MYSVYISILQCILRSYKLQGQFLSRRFMYACDLQPWLDLTILPFQEIDVLDLSPVEQNEERATIAQRKATTCKADRGRAGKYPAGSKGSRVTLHLSMHGIGEHVATCSSPSIPTHVRSSGTPKACYSVLYSIIWHGNTASDGYS